MLKYRSEQICLDMRQEVFRRELLEESGVNIAGVFDEDADAAETMDGGGNGLMAASPMEVKQQGRRR